MPPLRSLLALVFMVAHVHACARSPQDREAAAVPARRMVSLNGAQLELLDWGGAGEVLVFVPGLGASAHAFEGFANHFTDRFHVVGLTRRGHGSSEVTASGYDTATLSEDLRALLDELHVPRATFVAHSFGGEEVTCLAVQHPDRVAGLIYLEAAYDQAKGALALAGANPPPPPAPSAADAASAPAYGAYTARTYGMQLPVAEIEATYTFDHAGVHPRIPDRVIGAMRGGVKHCDDHAVRARALALYAVAGKLTDLAPFARDNPEIATKTQPFFDALGAYQAAEKARFLADVPGSRAVELRGAQHWIWTTHPREVEQEMRAFLGAP
jgi:non-heme chloroperoxidase